MNKSLDARLRQSGLRPGRELSTNFTANTLAKALADPADSGWLKRIFMRQALVRPAPVLVALGVVLTVSTAAYAAFNWQQIQVWFTGSHINKTFNTEEFGFDYKSCDALGGNNKLRFGVAKTAKVSAEELTAVIKAKCEAAQAQQLFESQADWKAKDRAHAASSDPNAKVDDVFLVGAIYTIDRIDGDQLYTSIALSDPHSKPTDPHTKPLNQTAQDSIAKEVRVFVNGKQVALASLQPGDRVMKVMHATQMEQNGQVKVGVQLVGLVKVDTQPVDPTLTDRVFQIMPCQNNPDMTCLDTPSPALRGNSFNREEGEGGNFNRRKDVSLAVDLSNAFKAQGRVVAIDNNGLTVQAFESEAQFRLNIAANNRTHAIQVGDAVAVMYIQKPTDNHKVINAADIVNSVLIMTDDETKF